VAFKYGRPLGPSIFCGVLDCVHLRALGGTTQNEVRARAGFDQRLEYWCLRALIAAMEMLPRPLARAAGVALGWLVYLAMGRLRRVGRKNLEMAFPEMSDTQRGNILRGVYRSLGWQLAEFCRMQQYTLEKAEKFIRYEGLENYLAARAKGKGVFVLTGHLGAWELSSFYHSLAGYPMSMVIRRLDNPLVDSYVNRIRSLHGNRVIHKDDFARGLITAMQQGDTVGILMDTNMTPPQGVFVPFFGVPACTASGLARVALKSEAAVLPGFLVWESAEKRYVLHFGRELELIRSGDAAENIVANTALFTATIESYVRRYPDQWLWVHRRWKTRPDGEGGIY